MGDIITESFEGVGIPSGWSVLKGAPDFDYTTSPLSGSKSLYIDNDAGGSQVKIPLGSAQSEVQLKLQLNVQSYPSTSNENIIQFKNSSGQNQATLLVSSSVPRFRGYNGSSIYTGPTNLVSGTTYYVWLDFITGTGDDSSIKLYYSTVDSKPASPAVSHSTGNATDDVDHIVIGPFSYRALGDILFDDVTVTVPDIVPAIDDVEVVTDGESAVSVTTVGFSDDPVFKLKHGAFTTGALTSSGTGGAYSVDFPDLSAFTVDTQGVPLEEAVQLVAEHAAESAEFDITITPKAGWSTTVFPAFTAGESTIFPVGFDVPDTSQAYAQDTIKINPDGAIETDLQTFKVLFFNPDTGIWEVAYITLQAEGAAPTPVHISHLELIGGSPTDSEKFKLNRKLNRWENGNQSVILPMQ